MARPTPVKRPIGLVILLLLIALTRGAIGQHTPEKTPPSPPGVGKSAARNVGDDTMKETRENIEANRAKNDHNDKVHPGLAKNAARNVGDDTVKETRENIEANKAKNDHNDKVHPGLAKSARRNVGDDTVKETRENIEANKAKNDHNDKVHGDRSGLGERKDSFPFPDLPFAPPIPPYLLPPPIPGMPFTPPFQIPRIPGIPSWPGFPLPPVQIPPFPFLYPPPA